MENFMIKLKIAMKYDKEENKKEAYKEYINCIEEITKLLKTEKLSEIQNKKLLEYGKKCFERSEVNYNYIEERNSSSSEKEKEKSMTTKVENNSEKVKKNENSPINKIQIFEKNKTETIDEEKLFQENKIINQKLLQNKNLTIKQNVKN
jgi:hypothetical protein